MKLLGGVSKLQLIFSLTLSLSLHYALNLSKKFPGSKAGSSVITAVVQVQSLAWELPHAMGMWPKRKKKKKLSKKHF